MENIKDDESNKKGGKIFRVGNENAEENREKEKKLTLILGHNMRLCYRRRFCSQHKKPYHKKQKGNGDHNPGPAISIGMYDENR